jgi:WD40 repeat protein
MRQARCVPMPSVQRLRRSLGWLGACLVVTACSATPGSTSASPTVTASRAALVSAYRGHTSMVYTVAWSPDGRRIASGGPELSHE